MIVCGLDLSLTNAGIAILADGRPTLLTSVGHGGKNGADYAHRSRRVRSQCQAVLNVLRDNIRNRLAGIDLAVIEGPSYGSVYGDPFDRAGLWHGVFGALDAKKVPIAVVAPSTLKKWVTGKGNADKAAVLATVREWCGPRVANHDEADSLALAYVGAYTLGDPIPFAPKERHRIGLEQVKWPEGLIRCESAK